MTSNLAVPLSEDDLEALDRFLLSDAASDQTLTLDALDGYLTAIVIGPTTVLPSQWLPGIWGPDKDDSPVYQSMDEANWIMELIMRHMNGIAWMLQDDADFFDPLIDSTTYEGDPRQYLDGEMWAYGFIKGLQLCRVDWQPLFDDPAACEALQPIRLLGSEGLTAEEEEQIRLPAQRDELSKKIAESVTAIHRFWLPRRQKPHESFVVSTVRRTAPKLGRNDPCPCGSGKKYKKCCEAGPTVH